MMNNQNASNSLPVNKVKINDKFWNPYIKLVKEVVIPYQWEVLNDRVPDAQPSHVIKNLRIAAGLEEGEFYGFFFQDTDLAKWLEAVAYSLQTSPNEKLEKLADKAIDLIGLAQQEDGYLNTYFTVKQKEKRWTNLEECHELYTAGHFIEAGVAYYQATGKQKMLDIVCKFADYIDEVFGPEPDKLHGYPGHQEIELALVRLYKVTKNEKYLRLSKYFLDVRGTEPYYFAEEWEKRNKISYWTMKETESPEKRRTYMQTHKPVREQKEAIGHAVRMVYMLHGMSEVAKESKDEKLYEACRTLWENIVNKQMYITGGIGSTSVGEAFTFDYDLPNDTVYSETCASIGLIHFAQSMMEIDYRYGYGDVIERALYNVIIASMSRDGKHFFYVNPLEVWPEASEKSPIREHVKAVRQKWFGCACCPPNLARLLTSLGRYIYTYNKDTVYVHQFISSEAEFKVSGSLIQVKQYSDYPWEGNIRLQLNMEKDCAFGLAVRIPGWCSDFTLKADGKEVEADLADGYVRLNRQFHNGSEITLKLAMPAMLMQANKKVRADLGKAAIRRGPVVYCIEEADNGNNIFDITLSADAERKATYEENFLSGAVTIETTGYRRKEDPVSQSVLYSPYTGKKEKIRIKAVPYCLWGNREPGEMEVWMKV